MKSLDEDALANEVKAIPKRRNDLIKALRDAGKLTYLMDERYGRLSRTYYKDLKEHRKNHGQDTRPAFDAKFCTDRARAMQDLVVAERNQDRIRRRLKKERLRRFQDMESDFEDQTSDGLSCSEDTGNRDARRVQVEMSREFVEEYLSNIDDNDLIDPLKVAASVHDHDSGWDAQAVGVGDTNGGSVAGVGTRMGRKIREWRTEMERIRQDEDERRRAWTKE